MTDDLPEGVPLSVMHNKGRPAYALVREGDEVVCYRLGPDRSFAKAISRVKLDAEERARLLAGYRAGEGEF